MKNLKLSGKLWALTALLLTAVLLVAGISIRSIGSILSASEEFSYAARLDTFLTQKEADHLNWINKVQELFVKNLETLDVTMDHTQCGLGKFLHGEEGRKLAEDRPELASHLDGIKIPHKNLHDSAAHIHKVWHKVHPGLGLTLAARLDDHRRWAASVAESLLEHKVVTVQMDASQCEFGKWLSGPEAGELARAWPEFGILMAKVTDHHDRLHASAAKIRAADTDAEKNGIYLEETMPELGKVENLFRQVQHLESGLEKAQAAARRFFDTETLPALKTTQAKMAGLAKALGAMRKEAEEEMNATGTRSRWTSLVVAAMSLVSGVLLSFLIIRSITVPIKRIIDGLNQGADQVASASGQVSSASQQLAEGSSEQAASIEETSSSLEEMSSMTSQNAENAKQADNLMQETHKVVVRADHSMGDLTRSMAEISSASDETSKIIKTIDEIAFQTNLLALNAAVEAARAGEAGAGFAVVADEVRNLAMRAADAAKSTAVLIEGTVKKISDGSALVAGTNEAFQQVAESSSKVGELVGEIAAASSEQSQGIGQINTAVTEMDRVVQGNAANAEESASASEEMNAQAEQMKAMVDELVALVDGSSKGQAGKRPGPVLSVAVKRRPEPRAAVKKIGPKGEKRPDELIPLDEAEFKDF